MQFSDEKNNCLYINSIATLRNIQECINDLIVLLENNKVNYHLLLINLYYKLKEDNQFELDKEINLIFKLLKFRWVRLENRDGVRFQHMKYTNPNWKTEFEENIILPNYFFKVKSSLLISTGEENENNNNDINNLKQNEINQFNLNICQNIYIQNQEGLENLVKTIPGIDLDEDESIKNIYNKINKKKLVTYNINNNNLTKNYWSFFELESKVNSISMVNFNNNKYLRIKKEIQYMYDNETNQEYYIFLSTDGNAYILGKINNKTKNKLSNEYDNNLNSYFKDIYPKLFNEENKEINCLYIPEFCLEKNINMSNINSTIKNIVNVEYSTKIESNNHENTKCLKYIQYDKEENDVVLEKPLFIAGININLQSDNPILFCNLIE